MKCALGLTTSDTVLNYKTFELDTKTATFPLDKNYTWIHCDENFIGYYTLDYTLDNWNYLAQLLYRPDTVGFFK